MSSSRLKTRQKFRHGIFENMIIFAWLSYQFLKIRRLTMVDKICDERHSQINYRLDIAEKRLNAHGERLDRIELANSRLEERLNSLINQLEQLNKTMKWFVGLMVGAFVSFFFYAVQKGLF